MANRTPQSQFVIATTPAIAAGIQQTRRILSAERMINVSMGAMVAEALSIAFPEQTAQAMRHVAEQGDVPDPDREALAEEHSSEDFAVKRRS